MSTEWTILTTKLPSFTAPGPGQQECLPPDPISFQLSESLFLNSLDLILFVDITKEKIKPIRF